MEQIDYEALNKRLSELDRRTELVNYIYRVQGSALRRLDYAQAGAALGVDWKTISNYCTQLADKKIIIFEGNGLKLNPAILKVS